MAKLTRIALFLLVPSILAVIFLAACRPDTAVEELEATLRPELVPPCGPDHNIDGQQAAGMTGDGNNMFDIGQLPADYEWETFGLFRDRLGICHPPGWTLEEDDFSFTLTPPNASNLDAPIEIIHGGLLVYFLPPTNPDQDGYDPFRPDHALDGWINEYEWVGDTESSSLEPGDIITATIGDREYARAVRSSRDPGKVTIYTLVRQDNQINGASVTLPSDSPHQALYEQIMNSLTAITPVFEPETSVESLEPGSTVQMMWPLDVVDGPVDDADDQPAVYQFEARAGQPVIFKADLHGPGNIIPEIYDPQGYLVSMFFIQEQNPRYVEIPRGGYLTVWPEQSGRYLLVFRPEGGELPEHLQEITTIDLTWLDLDLQPGSADLILQMEGTATLEQGEPEVLNLTADTQVIFVARTPGRCVPQIVLTVNDLAGDWEETDSFLGYNGVFLPLVDPCFTIAYGFTAPTTSEYELAVQSWVPAADYELLAVRVDGK